MPTPANPNPDAADVPPPPKTPHGTRHDPKRVHPVLDLAHWEAQFPLGKDGVRTGNSWVQSPEDVALLEQSRREAAKHGELGPSVPVDFFTWSLGIDTDRPWLTRLGGTPWREADKPWPTDSDGIPMHFLGQICFADSKDILPFELPGDVALIFGRWQSGWAFLPDDDGFLEWSSLKLAEPLQFQNGWTTELPFCYQGVIHRSVQYIDQEQADAAFTAAGSTHGAYNFASVQATSIGSFAHLPQCGPCGSDSNFTLIATLSSLYFRDRWPLCDIPSSLVKVSRDGTAHDTGSIPGLTLGIGDAGCIWISRDKYGEIELASACG
jgi:hypothetical protein